MLDHYRFLNSAKHVAYYGLKRNGKGYAQDVFSGLNAAGRYTITPVHPEADNVAGRRAMHTAKAVTPAPDSAVIVLKYEDARSALEDAKRGGVKQVWLALGSGGKDAVDYAKSIGLPAVYGCPLLFLDGQGFPHNLHRALARQFRKA